MKKIINIIISIIVIICFSKVVFKYYQYYKDSKEYSQVQVLKQEIDSKVSSIERSSLKEEYNLMEEKLLSINQDYKMWIDISNTNIHYPVVKGEDNDFYTTHNFNKEESISGAIFIDSNNNIDSDKNIVIYGHHMKNETMFHNLNYFKKEDFFNQNKITIIKNGIEYEYEPFSVYVAQVNEAVFNMGFNDNSEYNKYLKNLKAKSYFYKDINLDEDSEIVTLVTCSYEYDDARTIVHGIIYK